MTVTDAAGSIRKLSDERKALAKNNDELLVQIAKNSADKAYITILEAHLRHLKDDANQEIDLKAVSEHLNNELEKAKQAKNVHEKQHAIKQEEERNLHQERVKLKIEMEALAKQHKDVQEKVRNHSKVCDAKAKEKIDIEQEVVALEKQKRFEENHFDLIEMAIRKPGRHVLLETPKTDNHYLQRMLDEYSNKFDSEYQKLLDRAKRQQKDQLEGELYHLNEQISEKNNELAKIEAEIVHLEGQLKLTKDRLETAQEKLASLKKQRDEQNKKFNDERAQLEAERKELENEISKLIKAIDETRDRANESLKIIIGLEFEIKAYEKMLASGRHNLTYRRSRSVSRSSSRSSHSSRSSKSAVREQRRSSKNSDINLSLNKAKRLNSSSSSLSSGTERK